MPPVQQKTLEEERRFWHGESVKKLQVTVARVILALGIVVIVVLATVLMLTQPWGKLTVFLENPLDVGRAHVGLYIDGKLRAVFYLDGGVPYDKTFAVTRGAHSVGVDVSYSELLDIDGSIDYLEERTILLLHPQTVRLNVHHPSIGDSWY